MADSKASSKVRLARAIAALESISFLDMNPDVDLSDAVALAEAALRDIDRDHLLIIADTKSQPNQLTVHVVSAAGNDALVREIAPRVQALFDTLAVEVGSKPFVWEVQSNAE
jgi:hypothetical protein